VSRAGESQQVASRAAEILAGERRWLWPAMLHYYQEPLVLEEPRRQRLSQVLEHRGVLGWYALDSHAASGEVPVGEKVAEEPKRRPGLMGSEPLKERAPDGGVPRRDGDRLQRLASLRQGGRALEPVAEPPEAQLAPAHGEPDGHGGDKTRQREGHSTRPPEPAGVHSFAMMALSHIRA